MDDYVEKLLREVDVSNLTSTELKLKETLEATLEYLNIQRDLLSIIAGKVGVGESDVLGFFSRLETDDINRPWFQRSRIKPLLEIVNAQPVV